MRLYITGDIHGDIRRFFPENWKAKGFPPMEEDFILVLGDFGIPWESMPFWVKPDGGRAEGEKDEEKLDYLEELPATILFVDGNHENFEMLYSYPMENWNGGRVHRLRRNVFHLMRGEVFSLCGLRFFAFGGAKSIDRALRVESISWWREEIPSEEEFQSAKENLERAGHLVDLVFTHAAPIQFVSPHAKALGFDPMRSRDRAVQMLTELEPSMKYQRWYFGHYHRDFFDSERKARWMYQNIDWVAW